MAYDLKEVFRQFDIKTDVSAYGNGHINDTYLCQVEGDVILQRINSKVFVKPWEIMENIANVTAHLKQKIEAIGGDVDRETLVVVPTISGEPYYKADEDNYFRAYRFVENTVTHDYVENSQQMYEAGKAFGKFQRMLDDFPADTLYETIVDFHNTPVRVQQLRTAISNNAAGRLDSVLDEVKFAEEYSKYADIIMKAMSEGTVPERVTHNDTKINNILFDNKTDEGICVIDLDTVMPGSMLWDFGDALRFGASTAEEDEKDLGKVWFDLDRFEAFTQGFLGQMGDCITSKEIELLPVSAIILTYECGTRFLADYLNGDTYFKVHYEGQNLDRCRTQFKLVYDMEQKLQQMQEIVAKYAK